MGSFLHITNENTLVLLTEVIHKIKNSLGGIGGFAALLERDLGPDDPRTALSVRIQNGVIRTNDFVVNLMEFLQEPELSFVKMNPVPMIQQTWREFWEESDLPEPDLPIRIDGGLAPPEWKLDPDTFHKLAFHAFRFARSSGGAIECIRLSHEKKQKDLFQIFFPIGPHLVMDPAPGIQRIQTCEPIEAKLSLYIVIKMAKFNCANVSLLSPNPNQYILSVQFSEGISA